MSLYDSASLVMIPSGVKEDKLYSIKPTDGSGDFTFSRGSDIQATRVNASGLIEKAKVNLLLQSNQFDTTWLNAATTETGGQAGYDGTNNAWLLEKSGVNGRIQQSIVSSGLQTYSVYLKAGSSNWVFLLLTTNTGDQAAYFNLTNGSIGVGTRIDAKSEDVGNGWWRCSVTFNATTSTARIYVADGNGNVSGTSGNIYIQDAQLNHGLIAQDYVETTTTAVVEGLTADLPRLDYSGGASCPSLLLEPSRTNINTHSEYIDGWSDKINVTLTANASTSPEGVDNAYKVYPTATGSAYFFDSQNLTNATDYTYSIFVKADGVRYYQLTTSGGATSGNNYANFDLQEGTKVFDSGFNDADIESYGNGWYRIYVVFTAAATGVGRIVSVLIDEPTDGRLATIAKNGTDGSLVYGSVYESGSYATSYIPTYGTAAVRADDDCRANGIEDYIGKDEGTILVDVNIEEAVNTESYFMRVDASSFSDTIYIVRNTDKSVSGVLRAGNSTIFGASLSNQSGRIKAALAYKSGDFAFYINGTQVSTSSATYTNTFVYNDITLGEYKDATAQMSGLIKQALVFKTRLTNAELAALTTI